MRIVLLLALSLVASAQTTLRLRYGGEASAFRITAMSAATPTVVTVKNIYEQTAHTLSNGDTVYIHSVMGCANANGYGKVKTVNQSAGTFELTTTGDANVTCSGTFNSTYGVGWVGKVQTVTLRSNPRLLIPPSGTYRTRATDPDGAGASVSPMASENGEAWQGLINRYFANSYLDTACDGETKAACPNINSKMGDRSIPSKHNQFISEGTDLLNMAVVWYGDNSKTDYLAAVKYLINNYQKVPHWGYSGSNTTPADSSWIKLENFPCDMRSVYCGHSSGSDWISVGIGYAAVAFDLIRDQLTSDQRQAFANKVLNGWDGTACDNSLTFEAGTVSITTGTKILTGSGTSFTSDYSAGDYIYLKTSATGTGRVHVIASVDSDTQITTVYNADATYSGVEHGSVANTWTATTCGALRIASGHVEHVGGPVVPRTVTALTSGVDASTTSIPVTTSIDMLDAAPFYIICESEIMEVTVKGATTLTVTRGALGTTAAAHTSGRAVIWSRLIANARSEYYSSGPHRIVGNWRSNVQTQKQWGYMLACFALADVDARAADCAERIWNYHYDLTYPYQKDYWSEGTAGGQTQGYMVGRFNSQQVWMALMSEHAFTPVVSILESYYWRNLLNTLYLTRPGTWLYGPQYGSSDSWRANLWMHVPVAQAYHAGETETAWANYWWRNLASHHTASKYQSATEGVRAAPLAAIFMQSTDASTDIRASANKWRLGQTTDFDGIHAGSGYGIFTSKGGFTSTDSWVSAIGYYDITDHNLDWPYTPATYYISLGEEYLIADDASNGYLGSPSAGTNYFEIGGSAGSLKNTAAKPAYFLPDTCAGGQRNRFLRKSGSAAYTHVLIDAKDSYCTDRNVTLGQRHLVHLKGVGSNDFVVVFDNYAKTGALQMRTRINLFRADETTNTPTGTGTAFVFTKSAARLTGTVLFPNGASPTITTSTSTSAYKYTYDWGSVTSANMIAVHRVSGSLTDTGGTVAMLATVDSGSWAVDNDDSNNSWTVVFDRAGATATSRSWTTTRSGDGQCIVTGLAAGTYDVTRAAVTILSSQAVSDGDNTLRIASCNGAAAFAVTQSGAIADLDLTTTTLPNGTEDVAYSQSLSCTGGTPPYVFSVQSGTLHTGLSLDADTGLISGTPTATGTNAITFRCTDSQGTPDTDDSVINLTVSAAASALGLTGPNPLNQDLGTSGTFQFTATGGSASYTYSTVGTLPGGCSINTSSGLLSCTPTEVGNYDIQVCVDDGVEALLCINRRITVDDPGGDLTMIAQVVGSSALVQVRRSGLDANQSCKVIARDESGEQVGSATVAAGPASRPAVLTLSPLSCSEQPCTQVTFVASCGGSLGGNTGALTVSSASSNVSVRYQVAAATVAGTTHLRLRYGGTSALGSTSTVTACSGGVCSITLTRDSGPLWIADDRCSDDACNTVLASHPARPYMIQ